ncbi:hypothetical protein [Halodesulfovibrio marinisediminis]|uniref:Uncharacterized protein n=1 Tax=Halodesulfovibrio marinisediminis DSM 17456 TaxID=1121457 RepID=A0A1N6I3I8_9BACT|nr:hypothetical protein [Halodesulfovibrio marinisediminis]SIO26594.1 hypothetical protein SAMN02745161_2386 [Halodesulfovibrio marinisediminis DSM 17456]
MKKVLVLFVMACVTCLLTTPSSAITQQELESTLRAHALEHIDSMCKQRLDCGGKVRTCKLPNGKWIRTYCDLKKDTVKVDVHEVDNTGTYVGTIRYVKVTYEAIGRTKKEVLQQPFRVVEKNRVTKIRQYKNGKWQ